MSREEGDKDKKDEKEQGMDGGKGKGGQERETMNKIGKGMRRGMEALKDMRPVLTY